MESAPTRRLIVAGSFAGQFVAKLSVLALAYPVVYGWRKVSPSR